ncbi:MAG: hypothetical protein J6T52_07140 [Bacteroidaceae bacterium]|nr:hypothetical protein [Bacteroidaceae bacterium]
MFQPSDILSDLFLALLTAVHEIPCLDFRPEAKKTTQQHGNKEERN